MFMNIKIAICDDSEYFIAKIKKEVETNMLSLSFAQNNDISYTIETFNNPNELISMHKIVDFDIVFLDIEMGEMLGIYAADQMYETNNDILICYITSHRKYIQETIKHRAFRFIQKLDFKEDILEALQASINDLFFKNQRYSFKTGTTIVSLKLKDIMYIESSLRDITIHTKKEEFKERKSISSLETSFPPCFIRCHKSFVVNLNYVCSIRKYEFKLENGKEIPIGRQKYVETKAEFFKFLEQNY